MVVEAPKGEKLRTRIQNDVVTFFAARIIKNVVVIHSTPEVDKNIQELLLNNGVPVVYADHQGHADGMGLAKVARYLLNLATAVHADLKGLAAPMASSWANGAQGNDLKQSYDFIKGGGEKNGLIGVPATRDADVAQHKMSRAEILKEMLPFGRKLREGYGLANLPEGSVQGGRHPEGTSQENIYGMQRVKNESLKGFFELAETTKMIKDGVRKERKPFLLPVALHGSFRYIESPEGGLVKPKLTRRGRWSLVAAALGIPFGIARIEATLLMPYGEEAIIADLGFDWREQGEVFNDYAMRKIKPGLPSTAWGIYAEPVNQISEAIELSASS